MSQRNLGGITGDILGATAFFNRIGFFIWCNFIFKWDSLINPQN